MSACRPDFPRFEPMTVDDREGVAVKRADSMLAWFCNEELAKEWLRYRYVAAWEGISGCSIETNQLSTSQGGR